MYVKRKRGWSLWYHTPKVWYTSKKGDERGVRVGASNFNNEMIPYIRKKSMMHKNDSEFESKTKTNRKKYNFSKNIHGKQLLHMT